MDKIYYLSWKSGSLAKFNNNKENITDVEAGAFREEIWPERITRH